MPLAPGSRLGPYEILQSLGAGGMGEVYRARDSRLDRIVALKILSPDQTGGAERKQRFLQEAKAASALNHPHIVTIYDVGSENGVDYIAMEFVEGKTMDQLIPRNGMRIGELLRYAAQAAGALAKAHEAGIVHRDLKPSNLMVSPDGRVKVLDFGLAKRSRVAAAQAEATQTLALTGDGAVVGTAYYMSPEQAEGKPVDPRSDIFSFGAMLYEMATGQRPFTGGSPVAVLSSILREEPKSAGAVRTELPPELTRIIMRCLRKDPARRFQHMDDLKVALEELKEEFDSGTLDAMAGPPPRRQRSRSWGWAGLAGIVAVGAFVGWRLASSPPPASTVSVPAPLTSYPGTQGNATFSPDGNQIAFTWDGPAGDNFDIYVKLIGPGTPLRLTTDPAKDWFPRWSRDGRWIAFLRIAENSDHFSVILIPALGGPERRVGVFANNAVDAGLPVEGLCWTPDSKALVVSAAESPGRPNRLVLVPLEGGEQKVLTRPDPGSFGHTRPAISEDGRQLAFLQSGAGLAKLFVVGLSASMELQGEPRQLASKQPFVTRVEWLPGSREVLFATGIQGANSALYRRSLEPGAEEHVLPGTGTSSYEPAFSARAGRLAYTSGTSDSNFWSVDLTTRSAAMVRALSSSFRDVFPQFSPDGKRVVFYSNRSGSLQIWTANTDGSQPSPLTSLAGACASPRWSPDGLQILFDSNTGGTYHVYVVGADGGQPRQLNPGEAYFGNWSRDGRWIYFSSNRSGAEEVWKAPSGGGEAVRITHGGGAGASESPDGRTLYYVKRNGYDGIWKMPVEGGPETRVVPNVYRVNYAVMANGIYFTPHGARDSTSSVNFLNFATGAIAEIVKVPKPLDLGLGVSPDGRTLLYSQIDQTGSNLMLIENFR